MPNNFTTICWPAFTPPLTEVSTSGYLWTIVFLSPIAQHVWVAQAVWNPPAIGTMAIQVLVALSAISATLINQSKKRDFK